MSEAAEVVHDTAQTPVGIEPREGVTVVDQSNFEDYVQTKLPPVVEETGEEEGLDAAARESPKTSAPEPKEGDVEGTRVFFKGQWVGKNSFEYRLHVQTEAKAAEVKAKIDSAEKRAKETQERLDAAERERNELKEKYEPRKPDVLGPEPQPQQFSDIGEYSKALKEWTADATRREDMAKAATAAAERERATIAKNWEDRQKAISKDIPDYAEAINGSSVKVSDSLRDAIVESDVGPNILYHLATNPDVAEAMGKMTVGKMLREFGKLEASFAKTAEKPAPKASSVAEISKAPAPISPLRGASAPVSNGIGSDGEFHGSYEQYKAARLAGKIR